MFNIVNMGSTEIRVEQPKDYDPIHQITSRAFNSSAEANLISDLRKNKNLLLSLVAFNDKRLTGQITFSPVSMDKKSSLSLAGLAPLSVDLDYQRRGIGSLLVREGLHHLTAMKVDAVFVLGHPNFYSRLGFRPAHSSFGIKSEHDVPDSAFMAIELRPGSLSEVSGTVFYSEEFRKL